MFLRCTKPMLPLGTINRGQQQLINVFYSNSQVLFACVQYCTFKCYTVTCLNRFEDSYHKCVKSLFFGFARTDSVTELLVSLNLFKFCTILHNARVKFCAQSLNSRTF